VKVVDVAADFSALGNAAVNAIADFDEVGSD